MSTRRMLRVPHASKRATHGLTLVELLVAVVIIGVVLTLAVPAFNDSIARERVRGVNAQVVTDLKYAKSEAVHRGEAVRVDFRRNSTASCYAVYAINSGGTCDCLQGVERCAAGESGVAVDLLKLVTLPQRQGVTLSTDGGSTVIHHRRDFHTRALVISVTGPDGIELRTSLSERGRVATCSPNQTIGGVPACIL